MSTKLTPVQVNAIIFAMDQVAKWTALAVKARGNANMTAAESKADVAATQSTAAELVAEWDALDAAGS